MKSAKSALMHAALLGAGSLLMALTARPLAGHDALDFPVNPLGINRSPFGEVLAMAMQGPIDTFWYQGELAKAAPMVAQTDLERPPEAGCEHDYDCGHHPPHAESRADHEHARPWNDRFRVFLENLDRASTARTNPVRGSQALDLHIRRQVENKLRFAYRLDPSHYGNYNSYHFFLTEPQLGTRPILTPEAARLAQETIAYCLAEEHDPRPALTATAAATNVLHLMFTDQQAESPFYTAAQMRECLNLLDHCIARHLQLRERWIASGDAELLSAMRVLEMEDRFTFVRRIRDAAETAVIRYEREEAGLPPLENS